MVAAQVLFGTTDKLTIEGAVNKVKNAATLLGNSSYMRVHNNEVILSWLRAMDTDPISDDATDDDQTPAVTPGKNTSGSVKTGDTANPALWLALMAFAAAGMASAYAIRRKAKF